MCDQNPGPCEPVSGCKLSNLNALMDLLRFEVDEIKKQKKAKDPLERAQAIAEIAGSIFLPLVILFIGQQFTAESAKSSLRISHANLLRESIGELTSEDPARQALAIVGIRTALSSSDDAKMSDQAKSLLSEVKDALRLEISADIETARLTANNHSTFGERLLKDTSETIEDALTVRTAYRGIGLIHAAREVLPEMVTPESNQDLKRVESYLNAIVKNPESLPTSRIVKDKAFRAQVRMGLDKADCEWKDLMASITAFLDTAAKIDYENTTMNALVRDYSDVHNAFLPRLKSFSSPPELLRLIDRIEKRHRSLVLIGTLSQ